MKKNNNVQTRGQILTVSLIATVVALTSCESEGLPEPSMPILTPEKCELLSDTTVNFNNANQLSNGMSLIMDYIGCDKSYMAVVNFPMGLGQNNLNDLDDWRLQDNISLSFDENGYVHAADSNVVMKYAVYKAFKEPKVGINPSNGYKFGIQKSDRDAYFQAGVNLNLLHVIDEEPTNPEDIVIRNESEIAEKCNRVQARLDASDEKVSVVIQYDIPVDEKDIALLSKLLNERVTIDARGKLYAKVQGVEIIPELANKIGLINKTQNMFRIPSTSDKYKLYDGHPQVLVDSILYNENGELLSRFVPIGNGVYYNEDLAPIDGFKQLKDYDDGKINIIIMENFNSPFGENALGSVDDEFIQMFESKDAPGTNTKGPYSIRDKNYNLTNPVMGVYGTKPRAPVEIIPATGNHGKMNISKISDSGGNTYKKLAASTAYAKSVNNEYYPLMENNRIQFVFETNPIYMNPKDVRDEFGDIYITAGQAKFVYSSLIKGMSNALGNERDTYNWSNPFPRDKFMNMGILNLKDVCIVLTKEDSMEYAQKGEQANNSYDQYHNDSGVKSMLLRHYIEVSGLCKHKGSGYGELENTRSFIWKFLNEVGNQKVFGE